MNRLSAVLIAEALGTFLFFVGAGSVVLASHAGASGPGLVGIALGHGLALAVMVSALGAISGGHFNPAVTVAVRLAGRIEWTHAAAYVVAQLIGAAAAGYALAIVMPLRQPLTPSLARPRWTRPSPWARALPSRRS